MDIRNKDGKFAKGRKLFKEKSPNWKGGFSKCKECSRKLTLRKNITGLCRKCYLSKRVGEKHWNWKGGTKNNSGYIMVYYPEHPNCDQQGYVREHRLVMEKFLGRKLLINEQVHHMDKDKKNNKIENLKLFGSASEHTKKEWELGSFKNRGTK